MAYGLKYRKNFDGINDLTNVRYNVLLEIFQDGYVGAVADIEEMDKNPLQFRLDNSGDTHFVPIKKTSVNINIVDTGQFDYSEFYTSNAKKYKVVITSPVLNWQGYLVPQSYNSNLNYRQPFTLTASDGLHLLSSIDYDPDQSKTVTLAGFIADIENRIGLGTFDRTTTIQTEIGNVWDAMIYEGMFTDLNYEEALEMVLKSIGMQLRYWKIFPIIESFNVTNSADVQIINKDISLSFLAPIKTAKVTQKITTLPDLMLNGMVDDLSDLVESNVGHALPFDTLSKWVADPTAGGVIVNRGRSRSISHRDTSDYYTAINLELMPVNGREPFNLTGNEISYFVCRPVNATALTFSIKANFGKVAYFSGRGSATGLINPKLYPAKYVELKYGIYDEISNKSFNYTTMAWDITGRPTRANCNKLRITNPKDGDTTIYIETPATTGATTKVNFYLLGGSVEYVDTMSPATAQTMVENILSIDAIEVDGVSLVSDKELYNETSSVVDVAPNIDVLDYDISFGYCPSPPANTSLYYGSAFYHTNLAQIVNVVVQGNTIPWLQYIYQTLLYTQNVQRKKVYTCSLLLKSVVNPIWLRTTLMGDVVMTNSLTFDWKTSQISAELTEIMPYVYSAWTITSESTIGSSDWGGSGGTSGSVGGGGGSVDLSNCVVKTGATSQDIEGDISVDNMVSRGAVVAGALNATLPDDLPVSSPLLYGVSKYDDVTLKVNSNGQWYVATSGGTVVSFGTEVAGQSIQLIVAAITKTLALAGHTHNYQPSDNDLTAIAALTGTGLLKRTGTDTWVLDTNAYLTAITKTMVEAALTGNITTHTHSQYLTAITKAMVEAVLTGNVSTHSHSQYLTDITKTMVEAVLTGSITTHSHSQYLTAITKAMVENVLTGIITSHQHNYMPTSGGNFTNPITVLGQKVWYEGNDGSGSGLDADKLDGLHKDVFMRYEGWVNNPGYNANTMAGNTSGFTYANNAPYVGPVVNIEAGGYNLEINSQYNNDSLIAYRVKNADSGTWNTWRSFYNSANANLKTVDWYAKNLYGVNGLFDGAVVAGALNGTLPDDLPVSSPLLYGVSKYDDVTLKVNSNGQWYVATSGGTVVSFGTEVAGQSIQLIVAAITKTLALAGHTHNYQPSDNDLTAIAALTGTGLLKRTGTDTWVLDTNAYLTAITKTMVEAALTGNITTHTHSQYLTAITKAMVESALTGLITTHTHNYLPLSGGTLTNSAYGGQLVIDRTAAGGGAVILYKNSVDGWIKAMGVDYLGRPVFEGSVMWHSVNSNLKTVDWYAKTLYGVNGLFDGAVVAGALNGTLPDDLPVATGSLFGVIKTGLSLNNNVGIVNINGRHYTTTSTYTDAAVREITAELVLGTGNMTAGTLDQIQLAFAPLTTTRGLTGNIIATANGAGMSLTIGFRKDIGSGCWYLMIYNGTAATVVRDGILISIRGQQKI